jgi:Domain of unknown function (DUF932)
MERVVCRNTFQAAIMEPEKSIIRVRHNTKFDKERVGKQLATLVETIDKYKKMGDAMARVSKVVEAKRWALCLSPATVTSSVNWP